MQDDGVFLPHEIYSNYLAMIGKIKFSPREIDVMACLVKGRATKKIAYILSISPKTVATHIRNVMLKLEVNSREGIVDFIEKTNKLSTFHKYYQNLILSLNFQEALTQISKLINFETLLCCLISWPSHESKNFFIRFLEENLNAVGFKVCLDEREGKECGGSKMIYPIDFYIYIISSYSSNLPQIADQTGKNNSSPIFVFLNGEPLKEGLPKGIYISLYEQGNYHFLFLELLKKLCPTLNLDEIIVKFKQNYEAKSNFALKEEEKTEEIQPSSLQSLGLRKKKAGFFLTSALTLIVLSVMLVVFKSFSPTTNSWNYNSIRSDFILPTETALLDRSDLLTQIEQKLKVQKSDIQTIAIVGPGGAGKTTLAHQYAHQQKEKVIWVINAETKENLITSFEKLAEALGRTEEERQTLRSLQEIKRLLEREEKLIMFVKEHLKLYDSWFLLYDNVEKFRDIIKYFPQDSGTWGRGKVILTTQDSNIQNNACIHSIIPIGELPPNQKFTLFEKIISHGGIRPLTIHERDGAKRFLENIFPYPLDINLAASYLKSINASYRDYLENIIKGDKNFIHIQEDILKESGTYTKTRYGIVTVSAQQIVNSHPDFSELLLLLSLVNSRNIPRILLSKHKSNLIVDNFLYHLKKYSLITEEPSTSTISLHRTIQLVTLQYLTRFLNLDQKSPILQSIANTLGTCLSEANDYEDFIIEENLLTHVKTFLSHGPLLTDEMKGWIGAELGFVYYRLGLLDASKKAIEEGISYLNKCNNKENIKLARALSFLAIVKREMGHYDKSKALLEQVLITYKKHLPQNHVWIPRALGTLGIVYRELGSYEKAKHYFEESLTTFKKYSYKDSKFVSWALAHLGIIESDLGNDEKAKDLLEQALTIYRKTFSKYHPRVAWASVHLGSVYTNLGAYNKAKILLEESLLSHQSMFGKEHMKTAWILFHLGNVYKAQGNYKEAENLLRKCLIIYNKCDNKKPIELARVFNSLGQVYFLQNKLEIAETFFKKSLDIYKKKNYLDVYKVFENMADLYLHQANSKKSKESIQVIKHSKMQAASYLARALEIIKNHFPKDSPHITRVQNKLKYPYRIHKQ